MLLCQANWYVGQIKIQCVNILFYFSAIDLHSIQMKLLNCPMLVQFSIALFHILN